MSLASLQPSELVLRDIHPPVAPPWWPPAPGWWLVMAAVLVALTALVWWWRRRRRHRREIEAAFDAAVADADAPAARVAVMSDLLRRAARRIDPHADRLQGDAWLRFLDGTPPRKSRKPSSASTAAPFSSGPGRVLLDGGFRRDVTDEASDALRPLARRRYLQLMGVRS